MNEEIKEKIEFLKNIIKKDITWNSLPEKYLEEIEEYINNLIFCVKKSQSKIDKAIEYIEKDIRWFDSEYASIYGELCNCEGYNSNRLEVMVNPSNVLNILKEDK